MKLIQQIKHGWSWRSLIVPSGTTFGRNPRANYFTISIRVIK